MKRFDGILLISSLLLTIAALATGHFGVQYEIDKIPVEVRSKMADFDWIGVEWITFGLFIQTIALVCLILAISLYSFRLLKNRRPKQI
ncbi:MAG: hypothetical protein M3T96_02470 [Acidobacteriota bacterium]|nr:hypothetical protein [Acidobacteriota bacterium]